MDGALPSSKRKSSHPIANEDDIRSRNLTEDHDAYARAYGTRSARRRDAEMEAIKRELRNKEYRIESLQNQVEKLITSARNRSIVDQAIFLAALQLDTNLERCVSRVVIPYLPMHAVADDTGNNEEAFEHSAMLSWMLACRRDGSRLQQLASPELHMAAEAVETMCGMVAYKP